LFCIPNMAIGDFLKKIQQRSEIERKRIFWLLVILFGIIFFGLWILTVKQQINSLNKNKIRQELNLPQLEKQFKNLPKPELPKFDEEELKQLEELLNEEAKTP